jgi:hypothetical protein
MTRNEDIVRLLRTDEEWLRKMTMGAAMDSRIRRTLRQAEKRVAERPVLKPHLGRLFAVGAAAALIAVGVYRSAQRAATPAEQVAASDRVQLGSAPCVVTEDSMAKVYAGRCSIRLPSLSFDARAGTTVRAVEGALQLVYGTAVFDVAHVPPGQPAVVIGVGGGQIEVVGTRFEVEQQQKEGAVSLFEGRIRFRDPDGRVVEIRPGERFRWVNRGLEESSSGSASSRQDESPPVASSATYPPSGPMKPRAVEAHALESAPHASAKPSRRPSESNAGSASTAPPSSGTTASDVTIESQEMPGGGADAIHRGLSQAVDQVIRLRAQGKYQEAMAILRKLPRAQLDERTAEVLSFEEGNLLEHAGDDEATCRHWDDHVRRFPRGSYRGFVEAKIRSGCPNLHRLP